MDKVIQTLIKILSVTNPSISKLLTFSKSRLVKSNSFGTKYNSIISDFEIISPPIQTAKLKSLTEVEKKEILSAVLLIYPIADNSPEITELIFKADIHLSSDAEFIQIINDEDLINDISIAFNLLERKPPKFWKDYKNNNVNSENKLLEDDYRSEFYRMLGMKYIIGSEEESKTGRTDLVLKSSSINRKIFEFKIWERNDYKETTQQLLKYLTEIDDTGFVIMGNSKTNKNITEDEYEFVIKYSKYIEDSMNIKLTSHGLKYYEADYMINDNKKRVYHFILNLK